MNRFPYDYPDAVVLIEALFGGFTIEEIPVRMLDRTEGVSMHSGLKPIYYMLKVPLSILIIVIREKLLKGK